MANFHNVSSPYKNTPVTDFYLDEYVPVDIPTSIEDYELVIPSKYDERPDLLANELYGSPRLWWIFAQVNKDILIDPIGDFVSGVTITIPTNTTISGII